MTRFQHQDQGMEMVRLLARIETGVTGQTAATYQLGEKIDRLNEHMLSNGGKEVAAAVGKQAVICAQSRAAMEHAQDAFEASTAAVREIAGSLKAIRWILAAQGSLMLILILVLSLLAGVESDDLKSLIRATSSANVEAAEGL